MNLNPFRRKKPALFKFKPFSQKQLKVLKWWLDEDSPYKDYDGIICDGSVRAGKTVVMSLSYVMWAMGVLVLKISVWLAKQSVLSDVTYSNLCKRC